MLTKRDLLRSAAFAAVTTAAASSVPALAQDRPGFFKAKDIAEAGFIYGLPIVMNYGVMYEYAVDRNSGQFKAPFNQIKNEPNVFTYKDTAIVTPNSDTPYSFVWMDLRAEPIVLSVPAVDPKRYLCVPKIRFCNIDGEGRQGQVVRRRRRGAQSRDGEGRPCSEIDGSSTHYNRRHIRVGSGAGALRQTRSCGRDIRGGSSR